MVGTLLEDLLGRTEMLCFEGPMKDGGRFFVNFVSVCILWLPEWPSSTKNNLNTTNLQAREVAGGDCVKSWT